MASESVKQACVVDRSLTTYTKEFYENLLFHLTETTGGGIIVSHLKSEWKNPWLENQLKPTRAVLHHVPPGSLRYPRSTVWPSALLWKALNHIYPKILVLREYSPYVLGALVWAWMRKRPFVISTDVGDDFRLGDFTLTSTQRMLHRIANGLSNGIIACTGSAARRAVRLGKDYILAPHAIDSAIYTPDAEKAYSENIRIINVSSFYPWKGVDLAIKAFAIAAAKNPKLTLKLIGTGDIAPYERQAADLDVGSRVTFSSFLNTEALIAEYRQSDIFLLTSRTDTYGVVVHEATACGLPVIVSRNAGASEVLVSEGQNGHVIDPEDSPTIATRLSDLAQDQTLRMRFGAVSRRIAEEWCVRRNAAKTSDWLKQILQS